MNTSEAAVFLKTLDYGEGKTRKGRGQITNTTSAKAKLSLGPDRAYLA
jgi:hypothetical protein|tara:strand:+ start:408 stop:551 length:144 start_codon:yes stop_codon:yes gene_type:complete